MAAVSSITNNYLQPVQLPGLCAFMPKEFSPSAQVLMAFVHICGKTINNIKERAYELRKPDLPNRLFRVSTASSIEEYSKELLNMSEAITKAHGEAGIILKDFQKNILKAKEIALSFFVKNGNPLFFYTASKKDVDDKIADLVMETQSYCYDHLDMVKSPQPFFFSQKDLETFQISRSDITVHSVAMSCLAYALLQVGEVQAKDIIFQGKGVDEVLKNIISYLKKWGWKPIDTPREGDLAIYLSDDMMPQHIAVYLENGRVSSKPGLLNAHSYTHPLFDLAAFYGDKVVFFRKPITLEYFLSAFLKAIIKENSEISALADELIRETQKRRNYF